MMNDRGRPQLLDGSVAKAEAYGDERLSALIAV